jgi:hypothetical protein
MFHQGSDVVVDYNYNIILGRMSWECYAQTNICQSYYFYPRAYGCEGIHQYFLSLASNAPAYQFDYVSNYNYMNNCFDNGHSVDNLQLRLQNMVNFFSPVITSSGNDPLLNCQLMGMENELNNFSFVISPNPSANAIDLRFNQQLKDPVIRIYSSLGKLVYEQKYPASTAIHLETNLPEGCYFISVEAEQQHSTQKFFIAR